MEVYFVLLILLITVIIISGTYKTIIKLVNKVKSIYSKYQEKKELLQSKKESSVKEDSSQKDTKLK